MSEQSLMSDVMDLQYAFQILLKESSMKKVKAIMGEDKMKYLLSDEFSMKAGKLDVREGE